MKKIYISDERMFQFNSSPLLAEETLEKVKNLKYFTNQNNQISYDRNHPSQGFADLRKLKQFKELHDWFQKCIEEALKDLRISQKLKIIHSWANKSKKGQSHHGHGHPFSIISGTYYLTTSKLGGETWFRYPSTQWKKLISSYYDDLFTYIKPEAGKLILFPSNIMHGVKQNQDEQERYTLSFDTFFEGQLSTYETKGMDLFIKIGKDSEDGAGDLEEDESIWSKKEN